jgi:N-acetylneuraminic acid mutarotase
MDVDLRDVLRSAAAVPRDTPDLEQLQVRGRRHRRRRRVSAVVSSFVLVGATIAVAATIAPPESTGPQAPAAPTIAPPESTEPTVPAEPLPFASLPYGWTGLPAPPQVRHDAAAAWTGDQLLVWGGTVPQYSSAAEASGFVFDTRLGRWQDMADSPLVARVQPASAWTGAELLVWGGRSGEPPAALWFEDGAAYDPATGTWRRLPPAPISARAPLFVWTAHELIVWGTVDRWADIPTDGAAYNPVTNSWRPIATAPIELTDATAVWTGREMIVIGAKLSASNNMSTTATAVAAAYDPAADMWRFLPNPDLSPQASTAAWNGQELIAVDYGSSAAAYDPVTDAWRSLPDAPVSPRECRPQSAAMGRHVLVHLCGGTAVYDHINDSWTDVSTHEYAGWWFELIPADPVVVLLGKQVPGGPEVVLAYRPQA